jgi:lysophospholipid acyltransferase (LPLAT)-like uncharacterized protein
VSPLVWRVAEWPLGVTLAAATHAVLRTSTVHIEPLFARRPSIVVHWHAHLPVLLGLCGEARHWIMMSGSPYMAPIARMSTLLGLRLARGASGSGGQEALRILEAALARGESVELAVDGPAGPAFRARPGCVELAFRTGAPIVAVAYRASSFVITPGRWDRQVLPTPFATIDVLAREVPRLEGDTRETLLARVQASLDALRLDVGNA